MPSPCIHIDVFFILPQNNKVNGWYHIYMTWGISKNPLISNIPHASLHQHNKMNTNENSATSTCTFLKFTKNRTYVVSWISIWHKFCDNFHVDVSNMNDIYFYLYSVSKYNTFSQTIRQSIIIWQWQVMDCLNWIAYQSIQNWEPKI